ncbi:MULTISPECIES: isopeptide-forming domain-containing fimbrial protein [unclassified Streptococcus]|uniref:isopeptide-forming domain-containing fimbrial protein n=1 Tax=unclassified Streptococcus TaxID=2608887 RepID=UPI001D15E53A|nr:MULTISPECIES: isopeptide-forming domain-containing fimbrial protein [unclassified Streptococcus]MCQ9212445.1 isopeptide-forming domain-containing fimbrial protein [Streptococcus sp. B01]MCQ9213783.1 isopeptide-forming domain-containing fimbrial protein [Streptococcus sp. O1]
MLSVSAESTSSSLKVETIGNATITSDGCQRKIEKTEKVKWTLPRQPIDLVILQDTSGSFKDTIGKVQQALKELTTPVALDAYDPKNPRLIFTNDKDTTDRVMINTFQGLDGEHLFDTRGRRGGYIDSNFSTLVENIPETDRKYRYQIHASGLLNDTKAINDKINAFVTNGGTPTVPAIEDTIAEYHKIKGDMKNNRKTVFLLVTDGVANGVRKNGKVYIERSNYRSYALSNYFKSQGVPEASRYIPEAGQNYLDRAKELVEAGDKLKALVAGQADNTKDDGAVVVGFWEDVPSFTKGGSYGTAYLKGLNGTGVSIGDNRPVQTIFHEALQKVATNNSYYVNEQKDAKAFADKILKAVGQALVKENVEGEFQVTEGYTVDAVRINGKTVVETVKDPKKQIQGSVKQNGSKVTISVPDSVFNPGDNKFDYDLSRSTKAEIVDEENEVDPPADYKPKKETVEVPQLTGKFKVGEYETAELGSRTPQTVEVQELAYCYPTVTKTIKDRNQENDLGSVEDPLKLSKKPSYSALLDAASETFTYTVNYSYNNVPYEFKNNVMLVDPLDYRLEVVDVVASDSSGQTYNTRTVEKSDADGHKQTIVVADVPAKKASYEHLLLKKATMTITVRLKAEYQDKKNRDYLKLLQDSQGFGLANQASILWNGSTHPDETEHLKATPDGRDTVRRSNAVYVKPPVESEITKAVNNKEHEDLRTPAEEFTYTVKSPWPGIADSFELTDTVVDELEIVPNSARVTISDKSYERQGLIATVDSQKISVKLDKKSIDTITRLVTRKSSELPEVILTFKAKIRDNADVSKYNKNGVIKVPNTADLILNGRDPLTSNKVTVTPPKPTEPSVSKRINDTLTEFTTFDHVPYTYTITSSIPNDIGRYKKFVIKDTLDSKLEFDGVPTIKGTAADLFDVRVNGQTVTATVKADKFADLAKFSVVELEIPSKIKSGVSATGIENKAHLDVTNKENVDKEFESNPVNVTSPPVTKRINEKQTHLDIANEQEYTYNVKVALPTDITSYKKFIISDVVNDELKVINTDSNKPVIKGEAAKFFDVKVEGQTITATMKDFKNAVTLAEKEVELVIPSHIKAGVVTANIPNTARIQFTNKSDTSGEKETPPVTVTPPTDPTIDKKINDTLTEATVGIQEEYSYSITSKLPNDIAQYKSYVITDTLDSRLEFTSIAPSIEGEAAKFFDIKVEGQTVTATMKNIAKAGNLGNQSVKLVIPAKIKSGTKAEALPNTAKLSYVNKQDQAGEKESKPVTVTPPPIDKKVNDKQHVDLGSLSEQFTYIIDTKIPSLANQFEITDTLVNEVSFAGDVVVKVGGKEIQGVAVQKEGQTLTVSFNKEQVEAYANQSVQVMFGAKIGNGLPVDELVKRYPNETKDKALIPNTASYVINHDPKTKKDTDPVTITPPSPNSPDIAKKVNGLASATLAKRDEEFTYSIETSMPLNATAFTITDRLEDVLEFAVENEPVRVTLEGKETAAKIVAKEQNLQVDFPEDIVKANGGKPIVVTFKAKIKQGANLAAYAVEGQTTIPNTAKYTIDHRPNTSKDSNEVPVTPPTPEEPTIEKDVNGKAAATLASRDEVFTYHVKTTVPLDATAFSVKDTLVDVLEFVGGAPQATLKGQALDTDQIRIKGQTVTVQLTENQVKANGGQELILTFQAKIKDGANLSDYITKEEISVPNKASYVAGFPHQPELVKDSNEVPVIPPAPELPTIEKDVNGKATATLASRDEVFTYHVKTTVPLDATAFSVKDTLVDVLEFVGGAPQATLKGQALDTNQIRIKGQTVTVQLTEDQVKASGGQELILTFQAKIKDGANLSDYTTKEKTSVPNTASYVAHFPHQPELVKDSNEVPVIPPTPEEPTIEKDVNGGAAATLASRDEVFTYHVKTRVPLDATAFSVKDTLVDVLEFAGDSPQATLKGQALDINQIQIEGQTVTAQLTEEQVKASGGQELILTFQAKIKDGANLSDYTTKEKTSVPNKASYVAHFPHQPELVKDSNEVPVIPPTPELPTIEKDVNGEAAATLTSRDEVFTYHVKTRVPLDATAFSVKDTLVDVLEFVGDSFQATLKGQALDAGHIRIEGQTVTAQLTEEQVKASGGQELILTFQAKIKDGANLSDYATKEKTSVPNTASYVVHFPHQPELVKDSNEVPVTPPTPEEPTIEKDVNGEAAVTLTSRDEVFTYHVKTRVPLDATAFSVKDTLVDVLEFAGDSPQATLKGQALDTKQIQIERQTVTVQLTKEQVKASGGQELILTFQAKIKDGANLSDYATKEKTSVPNTASYVAHFPHQPELVKESNEVPVIPPTPEEPTIEKDVNGEAAATLASRDEIFTYHVKTRVPLDATAFSVKDMLVDVLEFAGDSPQVTLKGQALDAGHIRIEGQTVTAQLTEEQVKANGGQELILTFQAKIKDGANLSDYTTKEKTSVPNTASYIAGFPHQPELVKESNEVPVTPPTPEEPTIEKDVNGKAAATLASRDEVFTYHVKTRVPLDATAFSVKDTLVDVLEFVGGSPQATLKGQALDTNHIRIEGQTVTAQLTEEQVKANGGQELILTFQAKIKDGANLSDYTTKEKISVPNTASYVAGFPHQPELVKESNEVPVIPPTPTEPEIDKKINDNLEHLDVEREQTYMYNVTVAIPSDIKFYKEFVVSDELDAALELVETPVAYVDGYDAADVLDVHTEGRKITVSVKDFKRLEGFSKIQVYILSKIKADADLASYVDMKVLNVASLDFVNSNGIHGQKETKPVTVTPPPLPDTPQPPIPGEPYKTVSRVDGAEQASRLDLEQVTDLFRFDIVTTIPEDKVNEKTELTSFMITDTLDALLKVDAIAFKIEQPKFAQMKQSVQDQLDEVNKKLEELNARTSNVGTVDVARQVKEKVQELTNQLEIAKVNLEKWLEEKAAQNVASNPKDPEPVMDASEMLEEKPEDTVLDKTAGDKVSSESGERPDTEELNPEPKQVEDEEEAKLKAEIVALEEALKVAQTELEKVEAERDNSSVTSAADKVNLQREAEMLTAKLEKIDKAIAVLTNTNEKGELDLERLSKIAKVTVDGQYVEVDIENADILEVLRGSNVRLIIYSSIKDSSTLSDEIYANGIENTADVTFNHDPKTKKRTNMVKVVPKKPFIPVPQPPLPKGSIPPSPTPSEPEPLSPSTQQILPKTNSTNTHQLEIVSIVVFNLFIIVLMLRKKKYN